MPYLPPYDRTPPDVGLPTPRTPYLDNAVTPVHLAGKTARHAGRISVAPLAIGAAPAGCRTAGGRARGLLLTRRIRATRPG
ncbi:hypothetical protein GCM10023259_085050 [Thermocatellispora tengchongensis]